MVGGGAGGVGGVGVLVLDLTAQGKRVLVGVVGARISSLPGRWAICLRLINNTQSPIHPPTSLEGTLDPFLRDHQLSTIAMRQESTTPAASTQKTPAKLWMSRALLRCRVWTEL
ncbi:hypothetical protein EYF80_022175 [Liparis tanakae]|uniref:Uncharacterized protein n=1 Tax=Liparis tanakae TaxID=230148 RepID=A0A4Z2HP30_9TELE|nr:hypothetical protein EYF80_022175 [Liparis tanakae]